MALEINEIGIRMRVGGAGQDTGASGAAGAPDSAQPSAAEAREAMVEDCVRRVLQSLKAMRER